MENENMTMFWERVRLLQLSIADAYVRRAGVRQGEHYDLDQQRKCDQWLQELRDMHDQHPGWFLTYPGHGGPAL